MDGFSKQADSAEVSARVGRESEPDEEIMAQQLSLGFADLNEDFSLPEEWQLVKKLGKGAYGKVMEVIHQPTGRQYACKRFEHVFVND
jgi:serine/threonine protein kinase